MTLFMKATTWWWEMIHEYCVFLFMGWYWASPTSGSLPGGDWCDAWPRGLLMAIAMIWHGFQDQKKKEAWAHQKMGSEWLVDLRLSNDTWVFVRKKHLIATCENPFFYQPMLWDDMIPFFLSFSVFLKVESTSVDFSRARFSPTRRSKPCLIPEPKNGWRMDDAAVGGKEVPYFLDSKPWWYDFFIR